MPIFYVRSTDGSDGDNGTTWALAKATLAGAFAVAAAGDTIFVSQNHAETQASAMTLTSPGTAALPVRVLCGDDANEPPTALATTATITTTGSNNMTIAGFVYSYGITFSVGTSGTRALFMNSTSPFAIWFDSCALKHGAGATFSISVGSSTGSLDDNLVEFRNTTIQLGNSARTITVAGQCRWIDTVSAIVATAPGTLFTTANGIAAVIECDGVDFSGMGAGNLVNVAGRSPSRVKIQNCKLGGSAVLATGSNAGPGGAEVLLVNCDSADTNYRYQKALYQGDITQETTIVRTGGASDGTTPISRKMVSSANPEFFSPLESDPCVVWNETVGSSVTATIEIITDNVTLTDAEVWIEVEYLGTSGFPLSLFASDRAADILTTPANQTSSSVAWTTTGLGTPLKQKLSVAFTPQEKGPIKVRVILAKASTTMYFDPKVDIS